MLAKNVNDNACSLNERGACEFFASKLAPTNKLYGQIKYENATFKCRLSDSSPRNSAFVTLILYSSRLFMRPRPKRKLRARPVGPHKGRQHFPHP